MVMTFNPFGLSLVSYKGGKYKGTTSPYPITSGLQATFTFAKNTPTNVSGIGQGDMVMIYDNAGSLNLAWSPYTLNGTFQLTTQYYVWGVFNAVTYTDITGTDKELPFWASLTQTFNGKPAVATIDDVPNNVYQIQANGAISTAANQVGCNYGFSMLAGGPNTQTGQSTAFLDTGQLLNAGNAQGGAIYAPLKIVGLADIPNNNWTDPYPIVNVVINNHIYKPGTMSV